MRETAQLDAIIRVRRRLRRAHHLRRRSKRRRVDRRRERATAPPLPLPPSRRLRSPGFLPSVWKSTESCTAAAPTTRCPRPCSVLVACRRRPQTSTSRSSPSSAQRTGLRGGSVGPWRRRLRDFVPARAQVENHAAREDVGEHDREGDVQR